MEHDMQRLIDYLNTRYYMDFERFSLALSVVVIGGLVFGLVEGIIYHLTR